MKNNTIKILLVTLGVAAIVMVTSIVMIFVSGGLGSNDTTSNTGSAPAEQTTSTKLPDEEMTVIETVEGIQISEGVIDGVPTRQYSNGDGTEKSVIMLIHGLTGDKAAFDPMAILLAQEGALVVSIDAYAHGDRINDEGLSVFEIAVKTSEDMDKVFDYYETYEEADLSQIVLGGFSMGGFASYHYVANGERTPVALYTVASHANWDSMIGESVIYTTYVNGKTQTIKDASDKSAVDAFIAENSPYLTILEHEGTDYKIVLGEDDTTVPYQGGEQFYNEFSETNDGIIEYELIEGVGHEIDENIVMDMLDYLTILSK